MSRTTRQQREYERRRAEKQQERQARRAVRRRRTWVIVGVVVGLVVLAAAAVLIVLTAGNDGDDPEGTDQVTPGQEEPTEPEPLPTTDPQLYDAVADPALAEGRTWQATLHTSIGDIGLELDGAAAPQATANFLFLAREGYFDGTACHRLLPTSLLQCGDPTASGSGGPGYSFGPIENAPADDLYEAGTLAMARVEHDGESMGSQFFLVFADVTLPADTAGGYSVFGEVTGGIDLLEQVGAAGTDSGGTRPALDVIIERVTIS